MLDLFRKLFVSKIICRGILEINLTEIDINVN